MTSTLYNDHLLHAIWVLTLSIEYKYFSLRSSLSGFELCIAYIAHLWIMKRNLWTLDTWLISS